MDKIRDNLGPNLVIVPDFIEDVMRQHNMPLRDLETTTGVEKFTKIVSKVDIDSMVNINKIFSKTFFNTTVWYNTGILDSIINTSSYATGMFGSDNDILQVYYDKTLNQNDIILNKDKLNAYYRTVVTDNAVYVVLILGFTNFIINTNRDFINMVSDELINLMFKVFGEDRLLNTWMFKSYVEKKYRLLKK